MKKLLLITAFFVGASSMNHLTAQVRFNVNIGIPAWIPGGYAQADYYYMPEIDAYYNVPQRQFVYFDGYNWVFGASLPSWYDGYDMYSCHRVPVYESRPYMHADVYRERYAQYRTGYANRQPVYRQQPVIDNRYARNNNQGYGYGNQGYNNRNAYNQEYRHEDRGDYRSYERRENYSRDNGRRNDDRRDNDREREGRH